MEKNEKRILKKYLQTKKKYFQKDGSTVNIDFTRRLNPVTLVKELAMAVPARGSSPRCPTIIMEIT